MKIFFTCSFSGKTKYQKNFDHIVNLLLGFDIELISTETDTYTKLLSNKAKQKIKTPEKIHYLSVKRAIFEADAVIIDNSNESFRLGHEATLAIQYGKPTLVLSVHRDMSKFIKDKNFYGARYNEFTIKKILKDFIKKAEDKILDSRFNMLISKEQEDYLETKAREEKISKSEYIRRLIESDRE